MPPKDSARAPRRPAAPPRETRACSGCGALFKPTPTQLRRGQGRYCSVACVIAFVHTGSVRGPLSPERRAHLSAVLTGRAGTRTGDHRPQGLRTRVWIACEGCGAPVKQSPTEAAQGRARFCSRSCAARAVHTGRPKPKSRANVAAAAAANRGRTPWNKVAPVVKACEECGARIELRPCHVARTRFCSKRCKHAARRKITGQAHWLFTRVERACEWCGTVKLVKPAKLHEFRFCSRRCHGSWVSRSWPRTSSLERALHEQLTARGVPFATEHPVGPWSVDIAFPDQRLAVEADGAYWHGLPKQQVKDRAKATYLERHGWRLLRFPEEAIRADASGCADAIVAALTPPPPTP